MDFVAWIRWRFDLIAGADAFRLERMRRALAADALEEARLRQRMRLRRASPSAMVRTCEAFFGSPCP
jgi:hypothetical protein